MVILGGWVFLMSEVPIYPFSGPKNVTSSVRNSTSCGKTSKSYLSGTNAYQNAFGQDRPSPRVPGCAATLQEPSTQQRLVNSRWYLSGTNAYPNARKRVSPRIHGTSGKLKKKGRYRSTQRVLYLLIYLLLRLA